MMIHAASAGDEFDSCTNSSIAIVSVVFKTTEGAVPALMASNSSIADIQKRFAEVICSSSILSLKGHSTSRAMAAAAKAELARGIVIACNGRVLRSSVKTISEACQSAGATIEVSTPLFGGMLRCLPQSELRVTRGSQVRPASLSSLSAKGGTNLRGNRSISRIGLELIPLELSREAARSSESWRQKTGGGTRVTSHDLHSVFVNRVEPVGETSAEEEPRCGFCCGFSCGLARSRRKSISTTTEVFSEKAPFHPHDRWPEHYSKEEPDVVITCASLVCLVTELPRFLDLIDEEVERELGRKPRCCSANHSY